MIIFFVGSPLAGKSTLSKMLANKLGYIYFSTGDYYRQIKEHDDINNIRKFGISKLYNKKIKEKVIKICMNDNIIIDGFPRSEDQIKDILVMSHEKKINIIYVRANPVIIYSRINNRNRSDDKEKIVQDRISNAIHLKQLLDIYFGNNFITIINDGDINKAYEEILCHLLEKLEY